MLTDGVDDDPWADQVIPLCEQQPIPVLNARSMVPETELPAKVPEMRMLATYEAPGHDELPQEKLPSPAIEQVVPTVVSPEEPPHDHEIT
jgi:hypothetical protein